MPLLGDVPLLGELFKSRENTTVQSELVAFITPTIVDNPSENDTNFNLENSQWLKGLRHDLSDACP